MSQISKAVIITTLTALSIDFATSANKDVLEPLLEQALRAELSEQQIQYPIDSDLDALYEIYQLNLSEDGEEVIIDDEQAFQYQAIAGFSQPWKGEVFSKKANEKFNSDDAKLIKHLKSNHIIKSL